MKQRRSAKGFDVMNLLESSYLLSFSDSGRIPIYHFSRLFPVSLLPHSTIISTGNFNFVAMASTRHPTRPLELHTAIAAHLSFPDILNLKYTNRYLSALIPPLAHSELLEAEKTPLSSFARGTGILSTPEYYACKDCLRLRPKSKFADNMTKGGRGCKGSTAFTRFCLDCGLNPKPGTTRYTRGSIILVGGRKFVLCAECVRFKPAVAKSVVDKRRCHDCWDRTQAFQLGLDELARKRERREHRAAARVEREERHKRMKRIWGSSQSSDEDSESETASDRMFRLVQGEADWYMNSPGPGSD